MSEDEIEHRRPVWIALSDLFLDTDVRDRYAPIAEVLAASPFSEEDLKRILYDEVAPVLQPNLLAPAGVWDGFDPEWLAARVRERVGKRRWVPILAGIDEHWSAVAAAVRAIRASG